MGIFDKKICSVCGGEIGLLGNRKLEDGNLCKECASKLSPWFSDRRRSTVSDIKEQLAYREANRAAVAAFSPTVTFGPGYTKIHLDEKSGKFIVTRSSKWRDENPDVIDVKQLKACELKIEEDKDEIYTKDAEGKDVSYNPPRYEYEYEFRIEMQLDSPYYPEIEFELTKERPDSITGEAYKSYLKSAYEIQEALMPGKYQPQTISGDIAAQAAIGAIAATAAAALASGNPAIAGAWVCECGKENTENFCSSCGKPKPVRWFCPKCGKENTGNFCVACGQPKPAL